MLPWAPGLWSFHKGLDQTGSPGVGRAVPQPTRVRPCSVYFGPGIAGPWGSQAAALGRQGGHWLLLGPMLSLWYQPLEGIPWQVLLRIKHLWGSLGRPAVGSHMRLPLLVL